MLAWADIMLPLGQVAGPHWLRQSSDDEGPMGICIGKAILESHKSSLLLALCDCVSFGVCSRMRSGLNLASLSKILSTTLNPKP